MTASFDVIILGAGMAGASLAAELSPHRKLLLLELEDQPGRHATGRSAAMFFESYGNPTVRALTRASRAFLERPPQGFAQVPLMRQRAALFVADAQSLPRLDAMFAAADAPATLRRLDAAAALALVPILRPEALVAAALDDSGCDMDVAAIHQGYLRSARRAGAQLTLGAFEVAIERRADLWQLCSRAGEFQAPLLVNATGAWADVVAQQAGARALGLQPKRRTAVMLPAPAGHAIGAWPLTLDVDETVYFKPDAGQLLLSPANEDPMQPCDVAPEEIDVALAVDRFERLTTCKVDRIQRRWAGLRSFFADRSPVAGFDARTEGFFWLAGQGGYGIQMAPALARTAAALLRGLPLPADIAAQGVTPEALSPMRPELHADRAPA
jgi:D-arginine dehydrogenase